MDLITTLIIPVVLLYVGAVEKRIADMKAKLEATVSRQDAQDLINLNRRDQDVEVANIKADIVEVKQLLEKILDKLT